MTRVDVCPTPDCAFDAAERVERDEGRDEWTRILYEVGVGDCPDHGRWYWSPGTEKEEQ